MIKIKLHLAILKKILLNKMNQFLIISLSKVLKFKKKSNSQLYLINDIYPQDGMAAQCQRRIALYSLTNFLNLNFCSTKIDDIIIAPTDDIKSQSQRSRYIKDVNTFFDFQNSPLPNSYKKYKVDLLTSAKIFFFLLISIYSKSKIMLVVRNPYPVVDLVPNIYINYKKVFQEKFSQIRESKRQKIKIAIHYRYPLSATKNPDSVDRHVSPQRIVDALIKFVPDFILNRKDYVLIICTDAPSKTGVYKPPRDQIDDFKIRGILQKEKIYFEKRNLLNTEFKLLSPDKIIYGGNPLEAFKILLTSDYLFSGKSSFSYLAGILNKSQNVFIENNFWHSKLPGWKTY